MLLVVLETRVGILEVYGTISHVSCTHLTAFAVGQNGGMNRQDLFPNSLYLTLRTPLG